MTTIDAAALNRAEFVCSAHTHHEWPDDAGCEVAFVGRSNVGKSSAINVITRRSGLARTSKTPGRTRQIVFFKVSPKHRLVDLPGYGFARTSRDLQQHWRKTIDRYFRTRRSLQGVVMPVDIRRGLMPMDEEMLNWCLHHIKPVHLLLTKCDKLSRSAGQDALHAVQQQLSDSSLFTLQLFSATKKQGVTNAQTRIADLLAAEPHPL